MTKRYDSFTEIGDERQAIADLQGDVKSPEDQAYLDQAAAEVNEASSELRRRTGELVITAEGTVEPQDKMDKMVRSGEYGAAAHGDRHTR